VPVQHRSEEELLGIINDVLTDEEDGVSVAQVREFLEPERCKRCGCLLMPVVEGDRIDYTCPSCGD